MRKLSTMSSEEMDVFKIVLLGDVGVGKTGKSSFPHFAISVEEPRRKMTVIFDFSSLRQNHK